VFHDDLPYMRRRILFRRPDDDVALVELLRLECGRECVSVVPMSVTFFLMRGASKTCRPCKNRR